MKIVCSSCGAKYSIADEKVEGKVFKIRCKKCSNVIMVKGTEGEDVVSDAGSQDGAAEWYVVIDGEQIGPITSVEIDSYFMSGRIDRETYVWRDGLTDWQPMYEVTAFGHLTQDTAGPEEKTQISEGYSGTDDYGGALSGGGAVAGGAYDDSQSEPSDSDATVSMTTNDSDLDAGDDYGGDSDYGGGFSDFGGDDALQDDLAYAASQDSGGGGFGGGFESFDSGGGGLEASGGGGASDHGGMFASFDAPDSGGGGASGGDDDFLGFSSGGSDASPEPAPSNGSNGSNGANVGGAAANNMIGQRNENSVLFSLSSLDQVQAVSPEPASLGGGGAGPAAGGEGAGVTEGSGLIDIRSLASAHQSMKGQGNQDDSVDPFAGGTMAMPALMPMGSHRSNKGLIIAGVVGAVLFLGVAIAAIVVVLNSSNQEPQTKIVEKIIVQEKSSEEGEKDTAKEAEEAQAAEAKALAAAEKEDVKEEVEEDKKEEKKKTGSSSRTRTRDRDKKPDPAPTPARKVDRDKDKDDIDKLLSGIDKKEESKPKPKPKPRESSEKSSLSKSDVSGTIRRYSGRIATCKRSQNKNNLDGTMWVKFAIKPTGRTSNVSVSTGKFNGTDVGNCVKKAVQGMRFPATSASKNVDIKYPFKL